MSLEDCKLSHSLISRGREFQKLIARCKNVRCPEADLLSWDIQVILISGITVMNASTCLKSTTKLAKG